MRDARAHARHVRAVATRWEKDTSPCCRAARGPVGEIIENHYRNHYRTPGAKCGKLKQVKHLLEWRNWQTHGTQNPATFTGHEGSTPSSSTI